MPLNVADHGSIGLRALLTVPEKFLIFYSSLVRGEMWCPDCRNVEGLVKDIFSKEGVPDGLIVYVGDRSQWKADSNPYRNEPWHLKGIPTIVKIENGQEVKRLVEKEITSESLELLVKEE